MLHCWEDGPEGERSTCVLERYHEGPHYFTSDDEIIIDFANADEIEAEERRGR